MFLRDIVYTFCRQYRPFDDGGHIKQEVPDDFFGPLGQGDEFQGLGLWYLVFAACMAKCQRYHVNYYEGKNLKFGV